LVGQLKAFSDTRKKQRSAHTLKVFAFRAVLKYSECEPIKNLWTLKWYGPHTMVQSESYSVLK
jgi:hypothetical protein